MAGSSVNTSLEWTKTLNAAAEGLTAKVNKVKIDTVLWGELLFAGTCEHGTDGQLQSIKITIIKKRKKQKAWSIFKKIVLKYAQDSALEQMVRLPK